MGSAVGSGVAVESVDITILDAPIRKTIVLHNSVFVLGLPVMLVAILCSLFTGLMDPAISRINIFCETSANGGRLSMHSMHLIH